MTTATDLCNLALTLMGEKRVSDITTDTTKGGILCAAMYQDAIDEVLSEDIWACARAERVLEYREDVIDGITISAAGVAGVITFDTTSASYFENGDQVYFESITCADTSFKNTLEGSSLTLKNKSGNTFDLYDDEDVYDTSSYSAAVTAGTCRIYRAKYGYRYSLPSDFLHLRELYGTLDEWEIDGDFILADDDEITIIYTKQITDISKLSRWLHLPIAYNLALKIVDSLKGKGSDSYYKLYMTQLHLAKRAEGRWRQHRAESNEVVEL